MINRGFKKPCLSYGGHRGHRKTMMTWIKMNFHQQLHNYPSQNSTLGCRLIDRGPGLILSCRGCGSYVCITNCWYSDQPGDCNQRVAGLGLCQFGWCHLRRRANSATRLAKKLFGWARWQEDKLLAFHMFHNTLHHLVCWHIFFMIKTIQES